MSALADREALIVQIDGILPQTQCRRCGYQGCRPYAQAIVDGEADINQCPPGGEAGMRELAALLGRQFKPLSPDDGVEKPKELALIEEEQCIGCTLCIKACPVDAIVGASRLMHTIVAALCTGCELCVPACPVDCIRMEPANAEEGSHPSVPRDKAAADAARERFEFRNYRLARNQREKEQRLATLGAGGRAGLEQPVSSAISSEAIQELAEDAKKALIAAAVERARMRKEALMQRDTGAPNSPRQHEGASRAATGSTPASSASARRPTTS
jgi:electron transport complex protein RnfB